MTLKENIDIYDKIYKFKEFPDQFGFGFSPERMIIRNEALRTGNKELYETFLRERYPESADVELELFDRSLADTKEVTGTEAASFFVQYGVNVLLADLAFTDEDTIFQAKIMSDCEAGDEICESEEPIGAYVSIGQIAGREKVWLDVSEIRTLYRPK